MAAWRPDDDAERAAVEHLAAQSSTRHPRDLATQALLIRGARDRSHAVAAVLAARRSWVEWLTRSQRRWQMETRRPSRARHHDSIGIRETYVRIRRP